MNPPLPSSHSLFANTFSKKPHLATLLTALAFLGLAALSYEFLYPLCDDVFVVLLLKGVGMSPTPGEHNLFLNAGISIFLKLLYTRLPSVPWHGVIFTFVQALALWAVLLACQSGLQKGFKTVLTLVGCAVYVHLLTFLQWTTVSAFAAMGAFILSLALWSEKDQKPHWITLGLVSALFISSVLIRPAAFFLILILGLPAAVVVGWRSVLSPGRRTILKFLASTALVVVLALGYNAFHYHRDPEWAKAVKFFDLHSDLINGHRLHYDETTRPIFDSIGWTSNDLDLFLNWYFLDETTYSVENLERLRSSFTRYDPQKNALESPRNIFSLPSVQCAFWSALLFLFFVPRVAARLLAASALWTFLVLTALALHLKLPERVFLPALMLFMNLVIYSAVPKSPLPGRPSSWAKRFGYGVLVLVAVMNLGLLRWEKRVADELTVTRPRLYEDLKHYPLDPEHLYVIWDSAFPYELMGPFDDFEFFRKMNLVTLAWFQRTPTTKAMLDKFGVRDLFQDLVDNPKLHLICTEWEANAYKVYMIQKHDKRVELVPTFTSTFFTDYHVRSIQKP